MSASIKIANAGGYWGDDLRQFKRQIELAPIDFVTLDFLAEITMSIMQKQRARDPRAGYARDFVQMVEEALPAMIENGTRAISNAGGVNPLACRAALIEMAQQHGQDIEVAAVTGDDLMGRLGELNASGVTLDNMDDGAKFAAIRERVSSANAYYGAWPVVEALEAGARIVVTGRCTDTGITLAPMIHAFNWAPDDWDRLAAGIVAGHIVECGAQSTGGNFSDWRTVPRFHEIGYPVLEVFEDGSFIVTKQPGTGGRVSLRTVKEQLVYEMGDPRSYITPDVVADFASAKLEQAGKDRVRVWDIKGRPAPTSLKVSASYFDGWKAAGTLIISAPDAVDKANAFAQLFWKRLGLEFTETRTERIGHSACWGPLAPPVEPPEILLRLAVRDADKGKIAEFAKMLPAVILSGPPGVAVTGGRPPAQEVVAYWPALVPRDRVKPTLVTREGERVLDWPTPPREMEPPPPLPRMSWPVPVSGASKRMVTVPLSKLTHARSGDKGDTCNIGVIARAPEIYPWMKKALTATIVKRWFRGICKGKVERHEVPNLGALNFLLHECLGGGGTVSLRIDAQGKTLSHALLTMKVTVPQALVKAAERGDAEDGSMPKAEAARPARPARKAAGATSPRGRSNSARGGRGGKKRRRR